MERYGTFTQDDLRFEAYIRRRPDTLYEYVVKVYRDDELIREETVEMERYEHTDEQGNTQVRMVANPRDLVNVTRLEARSSEILEEVSANAT